MKHSAQWRLANSIRRTLRVSLVSAAAGLGLVAVTACESTPPPPPHLVPSPALVQEMTELPVLSFVIPIGESNMARRSGSAVMLSPRQLVFTLHQVDEENHTIRLSGDFATQYRVVASGDGTSELIHEQGPTADDWALVELDEPVPWEFRSAVVDWQRAIDVGEPVYLVGYPFGPALRNEGTRVRLILPDVQRQVIAGRAARRPAHHKAPRDVLYVHREAFDGVGLSGGAAAVWDDQEGAPVIIGIVAGSLEVKHRGHRTTYAMVVRPPLDEVWAER